MLPTCPGLELATSTFVCLLFWLAHGHYPLLPPMDPDESYMGSIRRRSPAIGLLAAGAVEMKDVLERVQLQVDRGSASSSNSGDNGHQKQLAHRRRYDRLLGEAPSLMFKDDANGNNGKVPLFVAPTADLSQTDKRNQSKYPHVSDTIRCYSCMSPFYESAWVQSLSRIYARPMNFSQQCDDTGTLRGIALVECPSICIKIREDIELSGIPFRGYIRGCYDTMLLHGFNQTLVRWFRWLQRDSCQDYNKYHILQLPPSQSKQSVQKPPSTLHICTCYADTCNGSPRYSGAIPVVIFFGRSLALSLATALGPLLVLICWWWRTSTSYVDSECYSRSCVGEKIERRIEAKA